MRWLFIIFFCFLPLRLQAMTVSPVLVERLVAPGETQEFSVRITNGGSSAASYQASFAEFRGAPLVLDSWITLQPKVLRLAAGATGEVRGMLRVPRTAMPGSTFATLLFEEQQNGAATLGGASVVPRIGVPVLIGVTGEAQYRLRTDGFTATVLSLGALSSTVAFAATEENFGSLHGRPSGEVRVMSPFGGQITTVPLGNSGALLLPGLRRENKGNWETGARFPGLYRAEYWWTDGRVPMERVQAVEFWLIPRDFIWYTLVTGVMLLGLAVMLHGRRKSLLLLLLFLGALGASTVQAQLMSSTNYQVTTDDLSAGGDANMTSTNYAAGATVSELTVPTEEGMSSASYAACAGFWCDVSEALLSMRLTVTNGSCSASTPDDTLAVPLGVLSTASVTTAPNKICLITTSTAGDGVVATVRSTNGALASATSPTATIDSVTATLSPGTEGYGVCVSNASGITGQSPYNGTCTTGGGNAVGQVTTTAQEIAASTGPVTDAYAEVLVKSAISVVTPAASDYEDGLTFVVTGYY